MTPTPEVQERFRRYLLGQLSNDAREELEKNLLTNDETYHELLMIEDEIVDEYLNGELADIDRVAFEQHFLATTDRNEKLKFGRAFKRYLSSQASMAEPAGPSISARAIPARRLWARWQNVFPQPFRIAVIAVLLVAIAFGVWRAFFHQSEVDKGLVALNAAYSQQRPVESRISSLSYAPFPQTRGGTDHVDTLALARADALLSNAILENPNAAAHHAIGEVYLTKKQFDLAIKEFEEALKSDSRNAKIHNDLGAALMEQANVVARPDDEGKGFQALALALQRFDTSLQIDPSLMEALFNRALCLQRMKAFTEAKKAWEQYLERDSASPWAAEARAALRTLSSVSRSTTMPEGVLETFLSAEDRNDKARAWSVLSQTREVVTGRMIALQLTEGFLQSGTSNDNEQAARMLKALNYAGELELENSGDPYVANLVRYYARTNPNQRNQLSQAHTELKAGFAAYIKSKYQAAQGSFQSSSRWFGLAQDIDEQKLVDYWIANCEAQNDNLKLSADHLAALVQFSEAHHYEWLKGQALWLLASDQFQLGEYSRSIQLDEQAIDASEKVSDGYTRQKILTQLANKYRQVKRPQAALSYHQRSLDLLGSEFDSARQKWRTYVGVAETFFLLGDLDAATIYQKEALSLAQDGIHDSGLLHSSYVQLAQIYAASKQYSAAKEAIELSLKQAQMIGDDQVSNKLVAYSTLQLGHINREQGDIGQALIDYDRAIQFYDPMEFHRDVYDAHKGRLMCYLALADDVAIERELLVVLDIFESHRARILDEQSRNSFFDAEQSVYDLAISYELRKGKDELAFKYSEVSRARSLLDALHHEKVQGKPGNVEDVYFHSMSETQSFSTLRDQLPPQIQIVQYAVLEDRLAIWLVSAGKLSVFQESIAGSEVTSAVTRYMKLITENHQPNDDEFRSEASALYKILIAPVANKLDLGTPLCIIPDKILFQLSFASLFSSERGTYLIEDFPMFFSPSLNVLAYSSKSRAAHATNSEERLLGIGNPAFDRKAYRDLNNLPGAEREVSEISRVYSRPVSLTREAATKDAVEKYLASADVVHFAGHYLIDSSNPLRSRLLLAVNPATAGSDGGALTAYDVSALNLKRPKLIVLSACETTGEQYYGGEGVVGMATTFLASGVPLVVASQWPVDSEATADLMIDFHRYRKQGYTTIKALRQAQINMIKAAEPQRRSAYLWAAFVPIGGFTAF